ncbi:MAG: amidohydrolase family protein [Armatimonadia bacterium]
MGTYAIVGARLIDGNGGAAQPESCLIVEEGRIASIVGSDVPSGATVIEAPGHTLMPGLIDCHQHVGHQYQALWRLQMNLRRGATTVAGVTSGVPGVKLRQAIEAGLVRGCPRFWVGGVVGASGGHLRWTEEWPSGIYADGPWEIRRGVRLLSSERVDFIKTCASGGFQFIDEGVTNEDYTVDELTAVVQEAHARQKRVIVHAHAQPALNAAIAAGCDLIHHGALIDEAALQGIKQQGLYYTPTLHITSEPVWSSNSFEEHTRERMAHAHPIHREGVRRAHELGLHLSVGTDGGPGDAAHELMELCNCGLSPMEAIVCGTRNSAEALGIEKQTGTLEAGKEADLMLVAGDPLENISSLYDGDSIRLVMRAGVVEYGTGEFHQFWQP